LIADDVNEGRSTQNVSEWGVRKNNASEAAEIFLEAQVALCAVLIDASRSAFYASRKAGAFTRTDVNVLGRISRVCVIDPGR
jgi:hypothetical protein